MSYLIPLITNFNNIRLAHFIKGVIYVIYLTPTYINIITIYSFSNISDVTWGNRPTGVTNETSKEDKEKQMNFKDYRSWFLVTWIIVNFLVGYSLTVMNRDIDLPILIQGVAYFLLVVISFKLVCS